MTCCWVCEFSFSSLFLQINITGLSLALPTMLHYLKWNNPFEDASFYSHRLTVVAVTSQLLINCDLLDLHTMDVSFLTLSAQSDQRAYIWVNITCASRCALCTHAKMCFYFVFFNFIHLDNLAVHLTLYMAACCDAL